jgi:hypothetical protein
MSATQLGIVVGMALGFAGAFGGFSAFIIVLFLGIIGFVIGRVLEGEFGFDSMFGRRRS